MDVHSTVFHTQHNPLYSIIYKKTPACLFIQQNDAFLLTFLKIWFNNEQ